MRRAVLRLIFCLLALGGAWAGVSCAEDATQGSTGASSSSGSSEAPMPGMPPKSELCIKGMADGKCDVLGGESCDCEDCKEAGICEEKSCGGEANVCDPVLDACTCQKCNNVHYCNNPTRSNCVTDGRCDPSYEGCSCDDCKMTDNCGKSLESCKHTAPDGACEVDESCDCVDCLGLWQCVLQCTPDLTCESDEPCTCEDCRGTAYCTDLTRCQDDGICDIIVEGCVCADCKDIPACDFMLDAGAMPPSSSSASSGAGGGM